MSGRRVCDSCHSRKVRCDRNDPCGNCLDQNSTCTRTRDMRRLPKRDLQSQSPRQRRARARGDDHPHALTLGPVRVAHRHNHNPNPMEQEQSQARDPSRATDVSYISTLPQQLELEQQSGLELDVEDNGFLVDILGDDQRFMILNHLDMNINMNMSMGYSWMSIVPLTEDQMVLRWQLDTSQDLTRTRRQVLESALSTAGRVLSSMEQGAETGVENGQSHIPSLELLYWMLNDIGSDKFGSFISDYFRHVSKDDLKHMGLSLISNTATPLESTLYTVCVNSLAFKFLNATLATGQDDDELAQNLRHNALLYRETAKAALKKIPLLIKPSLALLQALLCGIFLHQGSGDTNTCRELAKTACRVCIDINLYPSSFDLKAVTEAEYYCFMWCYKLDRNYAWKFGGPQILNIDPNILISPSTLNITASELILVNLELAKVQDGMIPFLNDPAKAERDNAFQPAHGVGTLFLQKMEAIRYDINQIKAPSPKWTGLDTASEIATLEFAYHCILTNLLHLRQLALIQAQPATTVDTYLNSARRGLQALISLCASSDRQKTVAYLHWTLLYYPITAYIALFCNAVATSHSGDFAILTTVSRCLAQMGPLSPPIAAIQGLFQEFVELCRCFFFDAGGYSGGEVVNADLDVRIDGTGNGNGNGNDLMPLSFPFGLEAVSTVGEEGQGFLTALEDI